MRELKDLKEKTTEIKKDIEELEKKILKVGSSKMLAVRGPPLTGHMTQLPPAIALPYARQCDAEDLIMEQLAALDVQEAEATAPRRIEQEA